MRRGGGFRILAALLLVGLFAAITAGAYGAGYAAAGGTGAMPWGQGVANGFAWGGFHIFGFLFTVLMLVVVFAIVRAVIWGHPHRHWDRFGPGGPGGPGDWHGRDRMHGSWRMRGDEAPRGGEFLTDWHKQAHSEAPSQWTGGPNQPGPTGTGPTAG